MIEVTERARHELQRILLGKVDMPQARLRLLSNEKGTLGLGIDIEVPGDQIVEYEGSSILVVESRLAASLRGVTIDVDETSKGAELVIA